MATTTLPTMKPLLTALVLSLTSLILCAQQTTSVQGNPEGSFCLMELLEAGKQAYREYQYQQAMDFSEQVLRDAEILGSQLGTAEGYFLKARCLNKLGEKQLALDEYDKAMPIFETLQRPDRMAACFSNKGIIEKEMGRIFASIYCYQQGIEYAGQSGSKKIKLMLLINLGNSLRRIGHYNEAVEKYYQVIELLSKVNDKKFRAEKLPIVYSNLGVIYSEQQLYKKALEVFERAKLHYYKNGMNDKAANVLNNAGNVHLRLEEFDQAKSLFNEALKIYIKTSDIIGQALITNNIGEILLLEGKFHESYTKLREALLLYESVNNYVHLPATFNLMGLNHLEQGNYTLAEQKLKTGLKIALETNNKISELRLYKSFVRLYRSTNNLQALAHYYEVRSNLEQKLYNQKLGHFLGQKEMESEIKVRDSQMADLKNKTANLKFEVDKRNMLLGLTILLVLVGLFIFFIVFRFQKLKAKNKQMVLEQKLIRTQLDPHFIFNCLAAIQDFIYQNAPQQASKYLARFSNLMRNILVNSRKELITLEEELEGLKTYLELQSLRFGNRLRYNIELDPKLNINETYLPTMLIQPLIENAVEHGLGPKKGKGKITIGIHEQNQALQVSVIDDGVGLGAHKNSNIYPIDRHLGLGNVLTLDRIKLLNHSRKRKIKFSLSDVKRVNSKVGGTCANFEIPII